MAGPSGVDAPAQPAPSMLDDPFRVFSALSQGDHNRAADLIVHMSDEDLASLRPVAVALGMLTEAECEARRRAEAMREAAERREAPLPEGLPAGQESDEWWAGANARAGTRAGTTGA